MTFPGLHSKVPHTRSLKQEKRSYTSESWVLEIKKMTGWGHSESFKEESGSGFFLISLSSCSSGVLVCISASKAPVL